MNSEFSTQNSAGGKKNTAPTTQNLQRARDTLLANHQEVSQHEHYNQPRQHKGVQAVVASQSALTDADTAAQQFNHQRAYKRDGFGDTGNDFNRPITDLIPRQRIAGHAERNSDDCQDSPVTQVNSRGFLKPPVR